ncbi:MAG: bifunctional isocitrate dehydrogenase kinase/phosphatase [Arenicellales bacterium]
MRVNNNAGLGGKIAEAILKGFNRHFTLFREITQAAKTRFEQADWEGESSARKERIYYYDLRVTESLETLKENFELEEFDQVLWQDVKRWYLWLLYDHIQPELAESFYNSVFCRLFDSSYYNNDYIFVKPGTAVEFLDLDHPVYASFYPDNEGLESCLRQMLLSFGLERPWQDIARDVRLSAQNMESVLTSSLRPAPYRQLHVVSSLFFRNKAAYIVGRAFVGLEALPFVIPILISDDLELYVDTVVTDINDLALIFSFTRAYFMVNTDVPSGLVSFLKSILPTKSNADLYTCIGFQKQGKTLFYREFLHHLEHSNDKLIIAPGIKGMVMSVFTLPSFPYVFKVIKDHFAPPKDVDRQTVKEKYQMVKMHDRVGRMADTLEFSHVAFPLHRFSDELLTELKQSIASSLVIDDRQLIIRHLYIERRMVPFNIYLDHANEELLEASVISYGNAIREMIAANIFPGDMLLKNFGVTRHGRVVFYDYDEICHMNEIRIRAIPKAQTEEQELSSEPWFHVGEDDFFPEQFEHFVINHPKVREKFLEHHPELLDPCYWKQVQKDIQEHKRHDVFPYATNRRFIRRYPELYQ